MDKLINYFSWLESRGLAYPASFKSSLDSMTAGSDLATAPCVVDAPSTIESPNTSPNDIPQDHSLDDSDGEQVEEPCTSKDLKPSNESITSEHRPYTIPSCKAVLLLEQMPTGAPLLTLTKLLRAINLQNREFHVVDCSNSRFDPGEFLDAVEESGCKALLVFSPRIAELILDEPFEKMSFRVIKTPYNFEALPSCTLEDLEKNPKIKPQLWRSLIEIFKIKVH